MVPSARGVVELRKCYQPECVVGLSDFSHMWIIFFFHESAEEGFKLKVRPPKLCGAKRGMFATRSPHRPSPIGLSVVRIERVVGRRVYITGLDMVDGTPVLDIKPYHYLDSIDTSPTVSAPSSLPFGCAAMKRTEERGGGMCEPPERGTGVNNRRMDSSRTSNKLAVMVTQTYSGQFVVRDGEEEHTEGFQEGGYCERRNILGSSSDCQSNQTKVLQDYETCLSAAGGRQSFRNPGWVPAANVIGGELDKGTAAVCRGSMVGCGGGGGGAELFAEAGEEGGDEVRREEHAKILFSPTCVAQFIQLVSSTTARSTTTHTSSTTNTYAASPSVSSHNTDTLCSPDQFGTSHYKPTNTSTADKSFLVSLDQCSLPAVSLQTPTVAQPQNEVESLPALSPAIPDLDGAAFSLQAFVGLCRSREEELLTVGSDFERGPAPQHQRKTRRDLGGVYPFTFFPSPGLFLTAVAECLALDPRPAHHVRQDQTWVRSRRGTCNRLGVVKTDS
eukprot:GHVQ01033870.1.p1 GENE.GHVQ01033870.1~~GHVQ01033870.1.p1  ORF type:complete len:502 (+),score=94.11 GHVQ01033870.1:217-1722(+)